jgi:hypothetical protein
LSGAYFVIQGENQPVRLDNQGEARAAEQCVHAGAPDTGNVLDADPAGQRLEYLAGLALEVGRQRLAGVVRGPRPPCYLAKRSDHLR